MGIKHLVFGAALLAAAPANAASLFEQISPTPAIYTLGPHYTVFSYSSAIPDFDITADIFVVRPSSGTGCVSSDFGGFIVGDIALINRGTCSFETKIGLAMSVGASAVLVYNNDPGADAINASGGATPFPAFFISNPVGVALVNDANFRTVTVRVALTNAVASVPEPAAWAMMLAGFGALGMALRRRKAIAALS